MINSYQDLVVWQKSRVLVKNVYQLTQLIPKSEQYSLTDQIRRAAVSIPSNIAEGFHRQTKKEYIQFLFIAYGSSAELETQLLLASDLNYISSAQLEPIQENLIHIRKMLNSLIQKLRGTPTKP